MTFDDDVILHKQRFFFLQEVVTDMAQNYAMCLAHVSRSKHHRKNMENPLNRSVILFLVLVETLLDYFLFHLTFWLCCYGYEISLYSIGGETFKMLELLRWMTTCGHLWSYCLSAQYRHIHYTFVLVT